MSRAVFYSVLLNIHHERYSHTSHQEQLQDVYMIASI